MWTSKILQYKNLLFKLRKPPIYPPNSLRKPPISLRKPPIYHLQSIIHMHLATVVQIYTNIFKENIDERDNFCV